MKVAGFVDAPGSADMDCLFCGTHHSSVMDHNMHMIQHGRLSGNACVGLACTITYEYNKSTHGVHVSHADNQGNGQIDTELPWPSVDLLRLFCDGLHNVQAKAAAYQSLCPFCGVKLTDYNMHMVLYHLPSQPQPQYPTNPWLASTVTSPGTVPGLSTMPGQPGPAMPGWQWLPAPTWPTTVQPAVVQPGQPLPSIYYTDAAAGYTVCPKCGLSNLNGAACAYCATKPKPKPKPVPNLADNQPRAKRRKFNLDDDD